MKNLFKIAKNVSINVLLAFIFSSAINMFVPVNVPAVALSITGGYFLLDTALTFSGAKTYGLQPHLYMAIQKEIWEKDLVDNLYRDNPFMAFAVNQDQNVLAGKVVHIPVVGSKPTVVKNRSTYPATAVQRADSDIAYVIDEYTTEPIHIPNADTIELSYDKRQNALSEHQASLSEVIGDDMLINWFKYTYNAITKRGHVIRTTGAAVAAHLPGATGDRKKLLKEDLKRAKTRLDNMGLPKNDRYALVDPEMESQLLEDPDLLKRDFGGEANLKEGIIGRLYGFTIIGRQYVLRFDNAGTPDVKALNAAAATTDNAAVLCWQKQAVEKAVGTVKVFENRDDATMYGDVYSALIRAGGRLRREAGVVAIVQDPA